MPVNKEGLGGAETIPAVGGGGYESWGALRKAAGSPIQGAPVGTGSTAQDTMELGGWRGAGGRGGWRDREESTAWEAGTKCHPYACGWDVLGWVSTYLCQMGLETLLKSTDKPASWLGHGHILC